MIKNINALKAQVVELQAMVAGRDTEIDVLHALYRQLEERLTRLEQDQFEQFNGIDIDEAMKDMNEGC